MKLRRLARSQRSVIQDDDENLSTNSEDPVVLDLSNIRRTTRQLSHRVINEEPLERDSRKRRTRYSKKTTTTGRTNQQRWKKTLSNTMSSSSSSSDAFDSCSSCEDSTSSSSSEETRQSSSEDQEVSWNTSSSTCVVRTKRRLEDFEDGEHVTIWNCVERRKIAGNAAPLAKNLKRYFEKHPECEIYAGQDLEEDTETRVAELKSNMAVSQSHGGVGGGHVSIWNRVEKRKIAGNAAPLWKNLENYLLKHPECEVYNGQDKEILERRRQKKFSMTKESKRKIRVSGATRSSKHVDACDSSVKEEPWSSSNNAVITNLDQPTTTEELKDIVIVKDSVEEEMTLFVDSVFSDHTKDLANFISWNDELCMEEVFLLDKGTKASKGDDDAALELSEEELSLLNDDLDVLVDFSASNCFSSSFCMTSGEGVSL